MINIQLIIVLVVVFFACLYTLKRITANFKKSNLGAKCGEGCEKNDILQSDK
jgi:hypothetical protein